MSTFTTPAVTVDGVVFRLINEELCVLLTKRQTEPFKDYWAIPGGYMSGEEATLEAVHRVLKSKAQIEQSSLRYIEQLYTFDTPAVKGGSALSIAYMGLLWEDRPPIQSEAQAFFPIHKLPELPFEHNKIIRFAHERLQNKLTYTNILFGLLAPRFTFAELQTAYETILGKKLDKRNFRKKFMQLGLIVETEVFHQDGAHRPARLYRFTKQGLHILSRQFE